jgi:hypothetical protein
VPDSSRAGGGTEREPNWQRKRLTVKAIENGTRWLREN